MKKHLIYPRLTMLTRYTHRGAVAYGYFAEHCLFPWNDHQCGIMAKNGILMLDMVDHLQERGLSLIATPVFYHLLASFRHRSEEYVSSRNRQ